MSTHNTPDQGDVFRRRMQARMRSMQNKYSQAPDRLETGPEYLGSYWQGEVQFWNVVSAESKPEPRAFLWGRLEGNTEETQVDAYTEVWLKELWR